MKLLPIETNNTKEKTIDYELIKKQFKTVILKSTQLQFNQIEFDWVK